MYFKLLLTDNEWTLPSMVVKFQWGDCLKPSVRTPRIPNPSVLEVVSILIVLKPQKFV